MKLRMFLIILVLAAFPLSESFGETLKIPDEATAKTLDGKTVSLAEHKGKLIFLNIWRTDCKVCLYEIPILNRIQKEYSSEDFTVIGIAMDRGKDEYVAQLADMADIGYPLWLGYGQPIAEYVDVPVTPVMFFIGPDGQVIGYRVGAFLSHEEAADLLRHILKRLAEQTGDKQS